MPLLSTMGAGSVRGWIPRGLPLPKSIQIQAVGAGGKATEGTNLDSGIYYAHGGGGGGVGTISNYSVTSGSTYFFTSDYITNNAYIATGSYAGPNTIVAAGGKDATVTTPSASPSGRGGSSASNNLGGTGTVASSRFQDAYSFGPIWLGGGGAGATGVGANANSNNPSHGAGGNGTTFTSWLDGSPIAYGGGGAGGNGGTYIYDYWIDAYYYISSANGSGLYGVGRSSTFYSYGTDYAYFEVRYPNTFAPLSSTFWTYANYGGYHVYTRSGGGELTFA